LISYLIGSLISMNLFTCLISFTTFKASQKFIKRLIAVAEGFPFLWDYFGFKEVLLFF